MKPRNFWMLFRQDATIALRNSLVWFMLFTALVMVLIIRFAIPENWQPEQAMVWHDGSQEQLLAAALRETGPGNRLVESPSELEEAVAAERDAMGIIYTGSVANPQITLVTNGDISPQRQNLIQASLEQMFAGLTGIDRPDYAIETLHPRAAAIPRNLSAVPVLLTFEVLITGFMLVAVLIFQEKQEGSIRAFRTSPGTVVGYIAAKTLVFTLLGLVYGNLLVLATMGIPENWALLLGAMAVGAAFYTLLGMAIAVFFSNLSEWFMPGFMVLVLNFLPIISSALPSFSPGFLAWIPSYHAVFGMGEILFPSGASLTPMFLYFGIGVALSFFLCCFLVNKKLMKEGK